MPSSILSAAVPAALSIGANAALGGGAPAGVAFRPPGINAGGLDMKLKKGQFRSTASPERLGFVDSVSGLFGNEADLTAGLRASVAPGISELRASRLAEIENARHAAIGDLRDNLARRRVLGSSFGADAISRAESEFGQQKDRVAAESFLQELELTNQLTNQEFSQRRAVFNTHLDELNLEANLAAKLASGATDALARTAMMDAQLAAQSAAGQGRFFNETFSPVAKSVGSLFGSRGSNVGFGSSANGWLGNTGFPGWISA